MLKDKIRQLREQHGFTQEQFAAKLNISTSSYARLEMGETQITMEKLDKIAKALGKDILELLDSSNKVSLSASSNNDHSQSHHAQTQTDFYHTQNYFYSNDALSAEVQRLTQELQHSIKIQEQQTLLIQQKDEEIAFLREILQKSA